MYPPSTLSTRIKYFSLAEWLLILVLASVPLFLSFPYRINIFLSWEGAYRLSQGQIPYRDFGMPLGYMYWVIPALFFKLFGTQMLTLIKAQVFINIISGLAFRSILKSLGVPSGIRLLSVLLYCISFSFFNFWPWYNHTVIVYQLVGLSFLLQYICRQPRVIWLLLSALFTFFSFFTKQDGGGLAFLLSITLLAYHCLVEKRWMPLLSYGGSVALIALIIIWPLTQYNFSYWFNHGQSPHTSRFSAYDLIREFLAGSQWIKFYMFFILLIGVAYFKKGQMFLEEKRDTLFLLLTLGILAEAAILQVTSYTPLDNNIFFHSFAFAFLLTFLARFFHLHFTAFKPLLAGAFGLLLWWSGVFWKYIERVADRLFPAESVAVVSTENIVNRHTYVNFKDSTEIPMSAWSFSELKSFEGLYMPTPTVEGIKRLLHNKALTQTKNPRVLNMTELTPLAAEIPFSLETGPEVPLWYHLGVAMFNGDAARYEKRIAAHYYDLVLFEHIPALNNFYPFRVRDSLQRHYQKVDVFAAPRRGDTQGVIEVYIRPVVQVAGGLSH